MEFHTAIDLMGHSLCQNRGEKLAHKFAYILD